MTISDELETLSDAEVDVAIDFTHPDAVDGRPPLVRPPRACMWSWGRRASARPTSTRSAD